MKRILSASFLLGLAIASGSSNLNAITTPRPVAAMVDAKGQVWAWREDASPHGAWQRLATVEDALVASIADSDVVVARRGGPVILWDGVTATTRRLPGLEDVWRLSCGTAHCLAATAKGQVFTWKPGEGTPRPAQVVGLTNVVDVAAGRGHSLALKEDGRVFAWGADDSGQRGQSNLGDSPVPIQVAAVAAAVSIGAGEPHSFAVLEDGTLRVWGGSHQMQPSGV